MKPSPVVKRSVSIYGHKTSLTLEEQFWARLKRIAAFRRISVFQLVAEIDHNRDHRNLSSAIRLFVLDHSPIYPQG